MDIDKDTAWAFYLKGWMDTHPAVCTIKDCAVCLEVKTARDKFESSQPLQNVTEDL